VLTFIWDWGQTWETPWPLLTKASHTYENMLNWFPAPGFTDRLPLGSQTNLLFLMLRSESQPTSLPCLYLETYRKQKKISEKRLSVKMGRESLIWTFYFTMTSPCKTRNLCYHTQAYLSGILCYTLYLI